jgi:hypothetical protein
MSSAPQSKATGKQPAAAPRLAEPPVHPLAGKVLSGADTVLQVLADEGVDVIFGYSGGAILPTYDAIFRYNENRPPRSRSGWWSRPPSKAPGSWRPAMPVRPVASAAFS